VIGAAAAKTLWEMHKHHHLHDLITTNFVVGVAVSAISGCAVIAWFLHYLAAQWFESRSPITACFWHNNTCSGFHRRPA